MIAEFITQNFKKQYFTTLILLIDESANSLYPAMVYLNHKRPRKQTFQDQKIIKNIFNIFNTV